MSVSLSERAHARRLWRQFAGAALAASHNPGAEATHLREPSLSSGRWVLPIPDDRAAGHICGALGPVARAYAYQTSAGRRGLLAPHLAAWAQLVLDILQDSEAPAAPPQTPFRADIDG